MAEDTLIGPLNWADIGPLQKIGYWPLSVHCRCHEGDGMILVTHLQV